MFGRAMATVASRCVASTVGHKERVRECVSSPHVVSAFKYRFVFQQHNFVGDDNFAAAS